MEFEIRAEEEVQQPKWQVILDHEGSRIVCGTFSTKSDAREAVWMYRRLQRQGVSNDNHG